MEDTDGALLFESTKIRPPAEYDDLDTRAKNTILEERLIENRKQ